MRNEYWGICSQKVLYCPCFTKVFEITVGERDSRKFPFDNIPRQVLSFRYYILFIRLNGFEYCISVYLKFNGCRSSLSKNAAKN